MSRGFLQDSNGDKSSTRLGMLWGLLVGGFICIVMAFRDTLSEGIFAFFMLASGGVYGWGKHQDTKEKIAEINAQTPPATLNIENIENADKITETGDVKITQKKA